MFPQPLRLFGSRRRTEVLIMLALLEQTYARELARLIKAPLFSVQTIVDRLESDGIVAVRSVGRTRVMTFNPRFVAVKELRGLLLKLARGEPELNAAAESRRSRPRRKGKPL